VSAEICKRIAHRVHYACRLPLLLPVELVSVLASKTRPEALQQHNTTAQREGPFVLQEVELVCGTSFSARQDQKLSKLAAAQPHQKKVRLYHYKGPELLCNRR
jgi:hypothetical protein